jgi:diguanylate cyclase (GGDEF)-like protein/PAS domain S-box-containing protein
MNTAVNIVEQRDSSYIDQSQTEELLSMQLSILELVAKNMQTGLVLEELCYLSEAMLPNSIASIMMFDETREYLNVHTAPSIPAEGVVHLDKLKPGPRSGSCGTAVYTGDPVFVGNVQTDYRWRDFREFVESFNIHSCWSVPIKSSKGTTIGSFALTSFEKQMPSFFHRCLLDTGAHLVAITLERKNQQQRLQLASIALENVSEGIIVTDADRRIIEVNQAFTDITGYKLEDVEFKNPRILSSGLESSEFYTKFWRDLETNGQWSGEIRNRRKNGEAFTEWLSVKCIYDNNGVISNYVSILTDISQLKEAEEKLRHLAHHDPLTNLPNRLYFQDRMDQALSHAGRLDKRLGLLFLDLDNFKDVNDSLGHQVGDRLLKAVSERLLHSLRKHDVIARQGGDEFLVLIEDVEEPLELRHIADHIQANLKKPIRVLNHDFNVSISIGISIYPDNGLDRDELLRNADSAMYEAKKRGRNRVAFYTPELTDTVQARVTLEEDLRKALNTEQLTLNYQPQFDAHSGRLTGAEALVRWQHPERGMIPPSEFIPIAEETGLISELGCWITTTACHQAQAWREKGLKDFELAINLSPHQLSGDCPLKLAQILDSTGFPAKLLELEITESLLMESGGKAIERLSMIKGLGIGLAMDDFGTGHSSMSQLKNLPIQKLKIDRSFISDIPRSSNDVAITRSIIAIGHALELKVTAEGVETEEQMEFLKSEKCDALQGYHLGRPVSAEKFEKILQKFQ